MLKGGLFVYTDYKMNDDNVQHNQKYEHVIDTISKRFLTYGYKRIKTSTFEQYDLYSMVNSSINQNEMLKMIDRLGQVLVLRPDVTIPITRKLAHDYTELPYELRYFYVQDVFRQNDEAIDEIESTQAGIEYFCESSPEADAEVIALAIHALKDLGFIDIKLELGHAGFFQEIINELNLSDVHLSQLQQLIQAKNAVEIEPFLRSLSVDEELIKAISEIPFLYGNPAIVRERAKQTILTDKMENKLSYLMEIDEYLKMYELDDHIVIDLGLINHMGYYSDIIFQGFVESHGKPVLMGGRYNQLGAKFGANLPAIGFAFQVDSLVEALGDQIPDEHYAVDVKIIYDTSKQKQAIKLASKLRQKDYRVLSLPKHKEKLDQQSSLHHFSLERDFSSLNGNKIDYETVDDLSKMISETEED